MQRFPSEFDVTCKEYNTLTRRSEGVSDVYENWDSVLVDEEYQIQGSGSKVQSSKFKVQSLEFRVQIDQVFLRLKMQADEIRQVVLMKNLKYDSN
ncbi:hypothetical protein BH09BAC3_BH09BAC3_12950 [soil metagenome]